MTTQRDARTTDADLDWEVQNLPSLRAYSGRWIAVLDGAIVTTAATAGELVEDLAQREIADALVTQVPADVDRRPYLIA